MWHWFPLLVFAMVAPFTPKLDLKVSHLFYANGAFYDNPFFHFLFEYGERISFFIFGAAVIFLSFVLFKKKKWSAWHEAALVFTATMLIGAGLLTNLVLKEYWGRPRPKQIEEFGGKLAYRPFWHPNFSTNRDPQKSFPSGHVTVGAAYLTFFLVGRRTKNPFLIFAGLAMSMFFGGGLMCARIAQGGHFFSDALASFVLMWYVALGADKLTHKWSQRSKERSSISSKPL